MVNGRLVAVGSPAGLIERYTPGLVAEVMVHDEEGFIRACGRLSLRVERFREALRIRVPDEATLSRLTETASVYIFLFSVEVFLLHQLLVDLLRLHAAPFYSLLRVSQ